MTREQLDGVAHSGVSPSVASNPEMVPAAIDWANVRHSLPPLVEADGHSSGQVLVAVACDATAFRADHFPDEFEQVIAFRTTVACLYSKDGSAQPGNEGSFEWRVPGSPDVLSGVAFWAVMPGAPGNIVFRSLAEVQAYWLTGGPAQVRSAESALAPAPAEQARTI